MNTQRSIYLASFLVALCFVGSLASCGKGPSPEGSPHAAPANAEATFSPDKLAERTLHRRANEGMAGKTWVLPDVEAAP